MIRYCLLLLLCINSERGQSQFTVKGSYALAAICKDGIIIGADSRGTIISLDNDTIGYYDASPKIFLIKHLGLSTVGDASYNGKYLSYYLTEYEKIMPNNINACTFYDSFFTFINNKYSQILKNMLQLRLTTIGFSEGHSCLCNYFHIAPYEKSICDNGCTAADTLSDFFNHYSLDNSCKKNAALLRESIKNYAIKYHTNYIGGNVEVLIMYKNGTTEWFHRTPRTEDINTDMEFYEAYKNKKIKITFYSDEKKKIFEGWVKEALGTN